LLVIPPAPTDVASCLTRPVTRPSTTVVVEMAVVVDFDVIRGNIETGIIKTVRLRGGGGRITVIIIIVVEISTQAYMHTVIHGAATGWGWCRRVVGLIRIPAAAAVRYALLLPLIRDVVVIAQLGSENTLRSRLLLLRLVTTMHRRPYRCRRDFSAI